MSQEQQETLQKKEAEFPGLLRRERTQRGWSQADVARKIGSDPKTVGRWERGVTFPSPYMCQQLSKLYGKSPQELGLVRAETLHPTQYELAASDESLSTSAEKAKGAIPFTLWPKSWLSRVFFVLALLIVILLLLNLAIQWPLRGRASAHPVTLPIPGNPYAHKGVIVLNERLAENSANGWSLKQNDQGQCFFADGAYRIRDVQAGFMEVCLANETYFINFTYEVTMTLEAGDCGGLAFRTTFPQLYYFLGCRDGNYRFVRYNKDHPADTRIIMQGITPAIHQGFSVKNVLAVVAVDNTFQVYVNHTLVVRSQDGAYLDGQIGMLAHTCRVVYADPRPNLCDAPTEVAFNDARVWKM